MMRFYIVVIIMLIQFNAVGQKSLKKAFQYYDTYQYSRALTEFKIQYQKDSVTDRILKVRMIRDCLGKLKNFQDATVWAGKIVNIPNTDPADIFAYATALKISESTGKPSGSIWCMRKPSPKQNLSLRRQMIC